LTTNLLIFTPSNLRRAAWQALLDKQPGIKIHDAIGDAADIVGSQLPLPGVILADLPEVQPELVGELQAALPDCGLLFLVDRYDLDEIVRFLQAGATGFITQDSSVGDLASAIIAAGRGEIVLPERLATRALLALARGEVNQGGPSDDLTEREQEVLAYLAQGHTNKDIAQSLFISVRTVEAHLHNIYGKLEVSSRTEAALWAVNHGYAPPD